MTEPETEYVPSGDWTVFSDVSGEQRRGDYGDPPDEAERSGDGAWATLWGIHDSARGELVPSPGGGIALKTWVRTTADPAKLTRQAEERT